MRGHSRAVAVSVLAVLAASVMSGCVDAPGKQSTTAASGPGAGASSAPAIRCGQARTAAGVPIDVEIVGRAHAPARSPRPRSRQEDGGEGLIDGRTARICDPCLRQADARPVASTWGVS